MKNIKKYNNTDNNDLLEILKVFSEPQTWLLLPQYYINESFIITHKGGEKEVKYNLVEKKNNIKTFKSNETDIVYNFNELSFRSDIFKIFEKDNLNILVSGCSNTFGQELLEENMWSNILKNKLNEINNKTVLYNISSPGLDTTRIIRNIYIFIEKYGKPDYILLLLPPIHRSLFLKNNDGFKYFGMNEEPIIKESIITLKNSFFKHGSNLPIIFANHIVHLKNLETFASLNNIKLYWHSWEKDSRIIYDSLNFKNHISERDFYIKEQEIINSYQNKKTKYWEKAADGMHPGFYRNLVWANGFYDKIKETI